MRSLKLFILIIIVIVGGYLGYRGVQAKRCPDSDGDKLNDCLELTLYHTERFSIDSDKDGFVDGEEVEHGYSPSYGENLKLSEVDSDRDGLVDAKEIELKTSLVSDDTDGDGVGDFLEIQNDSDPLNPEVKDSRLRSVKEKFFGGK